MKGKILIVDDEEGTCDALGEVLAEDGYQMFAALDGPSALDIVEKQKPDLVLLDINMPEMDGIEVLQRIGRISKDVVVVMITGYGALDTARNAMRSGAYDYVTKPFDLSLIRTVVQEALSQGKPGGPAA